MPDPDNPLKTEFQFGSTAIRIIQGDIIKAGISVDAVVSTDDNYLTMGSGVAHVLATHAGPYYVRAAQAQCPVRAGTVVVTRTYQLPEHGLDAKYVLHGTVIDYDTDDLPLEQLVYQTTANCLEKAEELRLRSILFPALATGAGGLDMETCARRMCTAIKVYLAQERSVKKIYIILYLPEEAGDASESARVAELRSRNQGFVREANLVLGVPYDPALNIHQARDFFGRAAELRRLEDIVTDQVEGKRHAVILGGPQIGKWALVDQFYHQAQQPNSALGQGRRLVKVTFGRLHVNTPASFIYRKFLSALSGEEGDPDVRKEIRRVYADTDLDCERFLEFLADHAERYPQVVLLIDHLPRLLDMESEEAEDFRHARTFWGDLDRLQERVRFVCTARHDDQYQALLERLDRFTVDFKNRIEVIELKCVSIQEGQHWVNELFRRYLGRRANRLEHRFFEKEAGRHPYLISLAGHALISALKPDAIANPGKGYDNARTLAPFFQATLNTTDEPRQSFFSLLMRTGIDRVDRFELSTLAKAVDIELEQESLVSDAAAGDSNAVARLAELRAQGDPRQALHRDQLQQLEARGYLVDVTEKAQFMSKSFAIWEAEYFGVSHRKVKSDEPGRVEISLLGPDKDPESQELLIKTLFRGRGARTITARTPLRHRDAFMRNFDSLIRNTLHPARYPDRGEFLNLEAVGDFILDSFTTGRIRGYLKHLPQGSAIFLEIDDALRDIPWELMLEPVYAGEIPCRIGRSIVSQEQSGRVAPPVRGDAKVRALLIGDPTDDLDEARREVQDLAQLLRDDGRFTVEDEDVLIGSESCRPLHLLSRLRSGEYGLIHYSGHSAFAGNQSAWMLKDGNINTLDLTSSLRDAPPALVFSSSCESAEADEPRPIRYEDQTFDLPSAFLKAGVEAYIGTLWEVESVAARQFVEEFYSALVSGGHNLGECLRLAKMSRKRRGDSVNWPAFILYGDPSTEPADLFPALRRPRRLRAWLTDTLKI